LIFLLVLKARDVLLASCWTGGESKCQGKK